MGISVTRFPSTITPAKNPAVFEFSASIYEDGTFARTTVHFSRDEVEGAVYQLFWDNNQISISLECAHNPRKDGTQFPPRVAETPGEWLNIVIGFFKFNAILTQDYELYVDEGSNSLILEAKKVGDTYNMVYNLFNCNAEVFLESAVGGKEKSNLKFGIQVHRRIGAAETKVAEDLVTPVISNGQATAQIDISELLQPALSCAFTNQSYGYPAAIARNEANLPFYICYYEQYGETPTNIQIFTSRWFFSLLGGVPPWLHVDFFKVYHNVTQYFLATGRYFLTWHWFPKVTDTKAPERLFLIVPRQPNTSVFLLKVTRHYYDDGDDYVYHSLITNLALGQVIEIDVSYPSIIGAFVENLVSYDVEVVSQDTSFRSSSFSFIVDVRSLPHTRYFMFLNSLGGYECVRFTGETIQELSFQRDFFDRATMSEYDENLILRSQLPPETTRSFKVNTGWISKETVDWMQDFLNSTEVFEIKGNNRYPVVIVQDKIELHRDSITLYSLTVTMEYADFPCIFQKEVDTPWEDVSQIEDPYLQD